jgi:hypothetical protein
MKMREIMNIVRESHDIVGLPADVRFREKQLHAAIARGGHNVFRAIATPGKEPGQYQVHLHPANPGKALPYQQRVGRDKTTYYDPELADLHTEDKGVEYLERTFARAKPHLSTEFEGLPEKDVMYRGMAAEEYEGFRKYGEIKSHGTYNIGDQQNGLTYWTTDPQSARSYANSFAPMQWKPTIGHPCYVVAATLPNPKDTRRVRGTGEHEIGVTRPVNADDVRAVWCGQVFDHTAEIYDLKPVDHHDYIDRAVGEDDTHRARYGGYSAQVVWKRIR